MNKIAYGTYLFSLTPLSEISKNDFLLVFSSLIIKEEFKNESIFLQLKDAGIVEFEIQLNNDRITKVFMRFSVANPPEIVPFVKKLILKLVELNFEIFDYLNKEKLTNSLTNFQSKFNEMKKDFEDHYKKVDRPISVDEVFSLIKNGNI